MPNFPRSEYRDEFLNLYRRSLAHVTVLLERHGLEGGVGGELVNDLSLAMALGPPPLDDDDEVPRPADSAVANAADDESPAIDRITEQAEWKPVMVSRILDLAGLANEVIAEGKVWEHLDEDERQAAMEYEPSTEAAIIALESVAHDAEPEGSYQTWWSLGAAFLSNHADAGFLATAWADAVDDESP